MKKKRVAGRLILEDGSEFPGEIFGKAKSQAGEVVFTTGMSGYPQSLSDPSFRGQILVATYPLIGNYGLPFDTKSGAIERDEHGIPLHYESDRVQVGGLVVSELCDEPSHFASTSTLAAWSSTTRFRAYRGWTPAPLPSGFASTGSCAARLSSTARAR